jgi:hypothetical protein
VLNEHGQPTEAEPLLREALATQARLLGSAHYVTSATRRELGYSLVLQGSSMEAERLLLEAYRDLSSRADHWGGKERRETLRRLVDLYRKGGRGREVPRPHPGNSSRTVHTAISMAAASARSPAGTAWRVFLMFTAPKYTAIT